MADPMNGPAPAAPGTPESPTADGPPAEQRPGAAPGPDEVGGPRPLGVPVTPTGQAAVDAGLARLAEAGHLPVSGHLAMYEDVHRGLRDVLASLDQHPGPPAPNHEPHDR
ncbi:hypothetical protein ADL22_31665 [Streptomyces sp. NRRL F-4489]|uniref:hypothetical protein n=1 Tax=Streptomyces sp. NRRL F-4489 TaxID=1609095 RepID=UPI00074ACB5B|nr:hypothetical protein [Streptomyces sp. NRRL F-4489]KUL33929.1 hypothetical protein ADL22_31665 [Streptomyces sp. NRRL F-4489]